MGPRGWGLDCLKFHLLQYLAEHSVQLNRCGAGGVPSQEGDAPDSADAFACTPKVQDAHVEATAAFRWNVTCYFITNLSSVR